MQISVHEAYEVLGADGHCLLDVRTPEEVAEMSVPGSLAIPLDMLGAESHQLASYTSIHVICRSGARGTVATQLLHALGMTHAKNVSGGIMAWAAAKLPVV